MRKLVTGFIAGTLVTIVVMLAILGDGEEIAAPSGENDPGATAADSPDADPEEIEQRRRAARSNTSTNATNTRAPRRQSVLPEENPGASRESGSAQSLAVFVGSDSGRSADVAEPVAAALLVPPAPGPELSRPFLRGKWEGVMTESGAEPDGSPSVVPPFDESRGRYGFRLDIRETNLVMYFQNRDQWIGLGEGQNLRTNEQGRLAVVITTLAAPNGGIELMALNIVRLTEDTIAVHMSRVTGAGPGGGPLPPPENSMGILDRARF